MYVLLLFLVLGKRGFIVLLCAILLRSRQIIDLAEEQEQVAAPITNDEQGDERNTGYNGKCYVFTINNPGANIKIHIEEHKELGEFLNENLIGIKYAIWSLEKVKTTKH